jgi:hypothetical protein
MGPAVPATRQPIWPLAAAATCCRSVWLNREGEVPGTAALKSESVGSEIGVGPWLAAVLVGTAQSIRGEVAIYRRQIAVNGPS